MKLIEARGKEDLLMVDLKNVARILCISTRTVIRMHKDGKLRLYRLGGKLFAKYDELKEDINAALEPVFPETIS